MTYMRKTKAVTKTVRYGLLGAGVGLLVVLGFIFITDANRGPSAREAERIREAQDRVHAITPDPVPAPHGR